MSCPWGHALGRLILADEIGWLLTVNFGTPSYEFTVNICTYFIF
jgi:hypothetical protein